MKDILVEISLIYKCQCCEELFHENIDMPSHMSLEFWLDSHKKAYNETIHQCFQKRLGIGKLVGVEIYD